MNRPQFIVVVCRAWMNDTGYGFNHFWDHLRFDSRAAAIRHGFARNGSDDFNVGTVRDRELIAVGWMDNDFATEAAGLPEIAEQIGLVAVDATT